MKQQKFLSPHEGSGMEDDGQNFRTSNFSDRFHWCNKNILTISGESGVAG